MPDLNLPSLRAEAERALELAEKATPGPWWVTQDLDEGDDDPAIGVASGPSHDYTSMVVTTSGSASFDMGEPTDKLADTRFIAASRITVPSLASAVLLLADRVQEQDAELAQARDLLRTVPFYEFARMQEDGDDISVAVVNAWEERRKPLVASSPSSTDGEA